MIYAPPQYIFALCPLHVLTILLALLPPVLSPSSSFWSGKSQEQACGAAVWLYSPAKDL